jgi:hypothetical protein
MSWQDGGVNDTQETLLKNIRWHVGQMAGRTYPGREVLNLADACMLLEIIDDLQAQVDELKSVVLWVIGLLIGIVACLALITICSLASMILILWWTMDSAGRHSIGAGKQMNRAAEMMQLTISQTAEMVRMQMELTETLLLGRRNQGIEPQLGVERTNEILPTPDELWNTLPDNIQGAMIREAEEASTWPNPSETWLNPSVNGAGAGLDVDPSSSPIP